MVLSLPITDIAAFLIRMTVRSRFNGKKVKRANPDSGEAALRYIAAKHCLNNYSERGIAANRLSSKVSCCLFLKQL